MPQRFRRQLIRNVEQTYCNVRTCMLHRSKSHKFCEIMGPTRPYDPTWLRNFIAQYTSTREEDSGFRAKVFAYMLATGHCLVHAANVVLGHKTCVCAGCRRDSAEDTRYPIAI